MSLLKKSCCLFLIVTFALTIGYIPSEVKALSTTPFALESKIYSQATIEDDFVDNHVLVVLTNEASLKFKAYTPADFPEITCAKTMELTEAVTPAVRLRVEDGVEKQGTTAVKISPQDPSTFNQILCLELPANNKAGVLEAIVALQKRDDVLYVGPDYYMHGYSTMPNDSLIESQWAVNKISLPLAWDITTGSSRVTVGVIDSGISSAHLDLQGNLNIGLSYDFITDQPCGSSIYAPAIHGTQVAGIIGAVGNNNRGVAGVCWDVTLISLRIMEENLTFTMGNFIEAVNYAESKNIDILNLSGGATGVDQSEITPMYQAVQNYSGLLVCAAGNSNSDNDVNFVYPGYLPFSNVMMVGASTAADQKKSDSNFGDYSVDLFAPGDNITTTAGSVYNSFGQTSSAAPFVTGVAALMMSIHPELTPAQIRQTIIDNVDIIPAFEYLSLSGGRLNAYKALSDDDIHSYTGNASGHTCTGTYCNYWEPHTVRVGSTACIVCGYDTSGLIMRVDTIVSEIA